jgi:hypothetical protein
MRHGNGLASVKSTEFLEYLATVSYGTTLLDTVLIFRTCANR